VVTQHGTCAGTRSMDVAKRGCSYLGVDRRGRRSSMGCVCDILAQRLIGLIRILIPTSCNFFFQKPIQKSLERWVTDRPGCTLVRTKCAEKTSLWGVGHFSNTQNKFASTRIDKDIRVDSRDFTGACGRSCAGMVCMAGVSPKWSHSMAHALALDPQAWPREDIPSLGLIDEDIDLLWGVYVTSRPKA
jgi:hypothetical protein